MKKCNSCGEAKEAGSFQKRMASQDFLTASCKVCLKERDRIRDQSSERKAMKKAYSLTDGGREAGNRAKRKYSENHLICRAAHCLVGNSIRDGKITREPCESCGAAIAQAHHDDYAKPLDIRWLCPTCHTEWHRHNTPLNKG